MINKDEPRVEKGTAAPSLSSSQGKERGTGVGRGGEEASLVDGPRTTPTKAALSNAGTGSV